jgi:tetratricopeptide (TPR) repeat protein
MPKRGMSPASLRHLKQYKDLTDEQFEVKIQDKSYESLIKAKMEELGQGYDFSELKPNDWDIFRRMAALMVRLERGEKALEELMKSEQIDPTNALREEQRLASMRDGILKFQDALGLTRIRRVEKTEGDPRKIFEDIRKRAQKFLNERLCHILCPQCGTLICSVNFLFPERDNNIHLECGRCNTVSDVSSKDALETERKNPYR